MPSQLQTQTLSQALFLQARLHQDLQQALNLQEQEYLISPWRRFILGNQLNHQVQVIGFLGLMLRILLSQPSLKMRVEVYSGLQLNHKIREVGSLGLNLSLQARMLGDLELLLSLQARVEGFLGLYPPSLQFHIVRYSAHKLKVKIQAPIQLQAMKLSQVLQSMDKTRIILEL